jgi:membrane protease YdiL (CAAX protease family)
MIHIEKMERRDWLWPALFLALGVAGGLTAYKLFFHAFPEASINLKLTRDEISARSLEFLRGRGLDTEGYRRTTLFSYDNQAKTYLERELGLQEANRVMASTVRIWRWQTRLSRPPQKEEMSVWLTTTGEFVGFSHKVEENRPGARLEKEGAQRIAEVFLRSERQLELSRYKLVTDEAVNRPNRLDYTFTWEEEGFKLKEATRRMRVTVIGDQVGEFEEFLKIPEQWTRDYAKLRSRNELFQNIANASYVLLLGGVIFVIARSARLSKIHWKAATAIGGVVGLLFAAQLWNSLPQVIQQFPTNTSYETLTAVLTVLFLIAGVVMAIYTMVLAAAGEPLYREVSPKHLALNHLFTLRGLRSKEFFNATLIGYGMAGMHLGLVALFYTLASRFGAWAPLDVNYDNTISTAVPWVAPLAMALVASTTEEFGFRLFAIPLLLRLTNSKVIAVVVPAFLWGFLHSAYPQQPAWIRGVEVGLIGIVAGWVFLRFGILATLVWHYTVDAILMAMFLMRSDVLTYRISGALVADAVLVPLLISVVFYFESRGFLKDRSTLNAAPDEPAPVPAEPAPVPESAAELETLAAPGRAVAASEQTTSVGLQAPAPLASFQFLPAEGMRLLVAGAVLALLLGLWVKQPSIGRVFKIRVTPREAEAAATKYLSEVKGGGAALYRRVTTLQDGIPGSATDYLLERFTPQEVGELYLTEVPSVFYQTRFFIPGQKEEFQVLVNLDGSPERYAHILEETAPGAQLSKPQAQSLAEKFLIRRKVPLDNFELVDHELEQRPARADHVLTWQDRLPSLSDNARRRISVAVKGDEVTGPRHWIKIPEEWEREHTRITIGVILPNVLIIVGGLLGLLLAARAISRFSPNWRFHLILAGIGAAVLLVHSMNGARGWALSYDTSIAWANFSTQRSLLALMLVVGGFVGLASLSVVAEILIAERFGRPRFWAPPGYERARALLEGLIAGIAGALILGGARLLISMVVDKIPSVTRSASSGIPSFPVAEAPGLAMFTGSLNSALWGTLIMCAAAAVFFRLLRSPLAAGLGLAVLVTVAAAAPALDPIHFLKMWISIAVTVVVLFALILLLRFNLISYLVLWLAASAIPAISAAWPHPGLHAFALQAAVFSFLLVIGMVIWIRYELAR